MTTITVFDDISGVHQGFEFDGHAGMAEAGEDIVCAGLSTLAITIVNSIESLVLSEDEYEELQSSKSGYIKLMLKKTNDETQLLIDSMLLGIRDMAREYPKYIRLISKEV